MSDRKDRPIEVADPLARKLMGQYLEHRRQDVENLGTALEAADFEKIRTTGHNLFGSGAAYGLHDISTIGASIENAAAEADAERIGSLIGELREFLDRHKLV